MNQQGGLEPIETASIDELRALQLERLRWSLKHAYENVPYYRKMFDVAAVHPDDLADLSDLAKFPFTTKASLRDNYPFGMFAVPREQVSRVHASSGTTGRPTVVGCTAKDIDTWAAVMARSIRAAGGRPGHIIHVAYGYGLFTGGLTTSTPRSSTRSPARSGLVSPAAGMTEPWVPQGH
jgi:phenylacetate-CoA ligase